MEVLRDWKLSEDFFEIPGSFDTGFDFGDFYFTRRIVVRYRSKIWYKYEIILNLRWEKFINLSDTR